MTPSYRPAPWPKPYVDPRDATFDWSDWLLDAEERLPGARQLSKAFPFSDTRVMRLGPHRVVVSLRTFDRDRMDALGAMVRLADILAIADRWRVVRVNGAPRENFLILPTKAQLRHLRTKPAPWPDLPPMPPLAELPMHRLWLAVLGKSGRGWRRLQPLWSGLGYGWERGQGKVRRYVAFDARSSTFRMRYGQDWDWSVVSTAYAASHELADEADAGDTGAFDRQRPVSVARALEFLEEWLVRW